jgi:hypothetical protein
MNGKGLIGEEHTFQAKTRKKFTQFRMNGLATRKL